MALHDTVIKMIRKNEEKSGSKETADSMIKSLSYWFLACLMTVIIWSSVIYIFKG